MSTSIVLVNPKFPHNVGAAIRAASCYGGGNVFFTGDRIDVENLKRLPREERMKDYQDTPWEHVPGHRPVDHIRRKTGDLVPVAVELVPSSENLAVFEHPDDALYIFGPEDGSLPTGIRTVCHRFVTIPSFHCLNLAAAVYTVLYDRTVKRWAQGKQDLPNIDGESRGWWHSPSLEEER
jgi:tRNA(Leu) C34 or U34 (ribose-2'-O)-methylase TrmL